MAQKLVSVVIPTRNRKEKLTTLLESVFKSTPTDLEVVVIDNASTDGTSNTVSKKFPRVRLFRSSENLGAVGGRCLGLKKSRGDYIFLVDDDNVLPPNAISRLVDLMEKNPDLGLVGPKMVYRSDPGIIWFAGAQINYLTSQTRYRGFGEKDEGQFDEVVETDHVPNAMFVRRAALEGGAHWDSIYVMSYGEADFAATVRRAGFKAVYYPGVTIQHDVAPALRGTLRAKLGFDSPYRVYYIARNRFIFMRRFAPKLNFWIFCLVFAPLFLIYYLANFVYHRRWDLVKPYLRGVGDGVKFVFKAKR